MLDYSKIIKPTDDITWTKSQYGNCVRAKNKDYNLTLTKDFNQFKKIERITLYQKNLNSGEVIYKFIDENTEQFEFINNLYLFGLAQTKG